MEKIINLREKTRDEILDEKIKSLEKEIENFKFSICKLELAENKRNKRIRETEPETKEEKATEPIWGAVKNFRYLFCLLLGIGISFAGMGGVLFLYSNNIIRGVMIAALICCTPPYLIKLWDAKDKNK